MKRLLLALGAGVAFYLLTVVGVFLGELLRAVLDEIDWQQEDF